MRHYRPIETGVNVYLLSDDSCVEVPPIDPDSVVRLFHGGHSHEVTSAEAALLTAAGYGANLT